MRKIFTLTILMSVLSVFGQHKQTVAVLNLDARNMIYNGEDAARLLRIEITKTEILAVIDVYEMGETFAENEFKTESCFSKRCAIEAGKVIGVDFIIGGSIERYGEKVILTLNKYDIATESIDNQIVVEFINRQEEIQRMLRIGAQKLLGTPLDQQLYDELVFVEVPVSNANSLIRLNGPRMGFNLTTGDAAARLTADKDDGGFEMIGSKDFAFSSQMGYQWEKRYIATNDFQALIEVIGLIGGMETGQLVPSLTFLNGFRFGKRNWEFGFGPTFRLVKFAKGFYDTDGIIGDPNKWHLERDWDLTETDSLGFINNTPNPYPIIDQLDSRGRIKGSMGMIFAFGRTFQSGRLNIPLNIYVSPRKTGTVIGLSLGFNIQSITNGQITMKDDK